MDKICLVGRTNVGKSTLFNRIIGRKKAIVHDTPNLTRDRNYELCEKNNKKFILIDTGGVVKEDGSFDKHWIAKNVALALNESSLIAMVVDGNEGYNPIDKEILDWVRKYKKPIILVVNKIDAPENENHIYDFASLGIDEMFAISALHKTGIDDLIEKITSVVKETKDDKETIDIKVACIGKPNVGKSSLINKILGEERVLVSDVPGTTRDAIDTYVEKDDTNFCFIDTAGIRRKDRFSDRINVLSVESAEASIDRSDICILLVDASAGFVEQDLRLARLIADHGKACVIAINKWDLIDERESYAKIILKEVRETFPFLSYAPIVFISAKTGMSVHKIFPILKNVYLEYTKILVSNAVSEFFSDLYNKRVPRRVNGRLIIIKKARQLKSKPPTFFLTLTKGGAIDKSYMKYIENNLRDKFGFSGTPIKICWDK